MKITDWTVWTPDANYHVFVELHTDEGVSGWGAVFSHRDQVVGALGWLKRFVIGENPVDVERITEKLHEVTFWLGRGGAMTHAISAINIALWDAAGKSLKQPVHRLLGGRHFDSVRAYGSVLFLPTETLTKRIETMRERGFRAIKLGWEPFGRQPLKADEAMIREARKAAGDETTLLIDAGGSDPFWSLHYKDALERAKMLANYGVTWFEEALKPDDMEGYSRLADASPVKISHGEVLTRRQTFLPYFQRRAMDIVQPDAAKVGGLSEMRRLAWMAEGYGIELVPHGWNTAVGVASDIHLVSSLPYRSFVEFNVGNPMVEELLASPFKLDAEGCLKVSDAPGLGIELDRDRLARFQKEGFSSETWTWEIQKLYEASAPR